MGYAGAILKYNGRILFQLRDEKGRNPNKWGLFGGGIKSGEKPIDALIREIKEELGIKLSKSDVLRKYKVPLVNYNIVEVNLREIPKKQNLREGKDMKFMTTKEFLNKKDALLRVKLFFKLFRIK